MTEMIESVALVKAYLDLDNGYFGLRIDSSYYGPRVFSDPINDYVIAEYLAFIV
jgi:hypothetical protein